MWPGVSARNINKTAANDDGMSFIYLDFRGGGVEGNEIDLYIV